MLVELIVFTKIAVGFTPARLSEESDSLSEPVLREPKSGAAPGVRTPGAAGMEQGARRVGKKTYPPQTAESVRQICSR